MAGTIVVDRIESDASYASTINVAGQITFSNTVNFGVFGGTAPVAGFYLPSTSNLAFTTASTERMRIDSAGNVGIGTSSPASKLHISNAGSVADNCFNVSTPANDNVLLGANLVVDAAGIYTKPATSISGAGILFEGINSLAGHGSIQFLSAPDTNDGSATPLERMRIDSSGNLKFDSGYGSVATAYGCRAWVNFNGTSTVAIRASGNVTSITDNGTGNYTVNFTTAMSDANYSVSGSGSAPATYAGGFVMFVDESTSPTTSAVKLKFHRPGVGDVDTLFCNVSIFR